MCKYLIQEDDLTGKEVHALLDLHMAGMLGNSPAESVFALDLSGLQQPDVTVWSVWCDERLAGIGALKQLDDGLTGELKSMRTAPEFLRAGVGSTLLDHILAHAQNQGLVRVSLETGTGKAFEPALALYRKRGFVKGEAFGGYSDSDFSQFFHLTFENLGVLR